MKVCNQELARDEPGSISILPDQDDDLWYVYNLLSPGDFIIAPTVRKIVRETASGAKDAQRVRLVLEIRVQAVDFEKEPSIVRVRGKNISEKQCMAFGQSHTIELRRSTEFVLRKAAWDSTALDVLREACDPAASADLAVILMHEGLAHILLVGRSITTTRGRIALPIPRKHGGGISGYEQALNKFFENVLKCMLRSVDFKVVRCVVIAGPGFTKDQFHDYLLLEAERKELKTVIENKSRIVLAHAASGYKHSLQDVLGAPSVMSLIKDTKAAREVQVLKDFMAMMLKDPDRACYGPRHVAVAHERKAIQSLLIIDELLRSSDVEVRRRHVELVKSVEESGGTAYVFSSMHESGEQLAQHTGIAAILYFPLPELDDIEM